MLSGKLSRQGGDRGNSPERQSVGEAAGFLPAIVASWRQPAMRRYVLVIVFLEFWWTTRQLQVDEGDAETVMLATWRRRGRRRG
jgi:hypothetical protein